MSAAIPMREARSVAVPALRRPRLGFLGVGWIGLDRLQAIHATGLADIAALADANPEMVARAAEAAPGAERAETLDALLRHDLDGVVIATPSALHAEQCLAALAAGVAVFCQKPLGRTGEETRAVVAAARRADRLLGVDFSYRFTEGMAALRREVAGGGLGRIHAIDFTFHNAYGPDKPWFHDPALAGGGAMMDLGIHLIDLALWLLDFPRVERVEAHLSAGGEPLADPDRQVEDHAVATLTLAGGTVVRLAASWWLHAGQDAVIAAEVYGTAGGAAFRNVGGSFYDFTAERFERTARRTLTAPPPGGREPWGGRAAAAWVRRLAAGERFAPEAEELVAVADVLDRLYWRG
ncbi:Gfo/Idh/MocA family protein [Ancylobacter lacus]|uniref:Gfo/Idh/MocA family protein n=1 Tax=Ancylobacter lacus TaxID=2579970 RepID=UPI001BCBCB0B|nr:Gfo/Idh/MocA family oxidoreductase [Ancylobacter lacus]MBS7538404.1 Gfo/Idh/MocA family oxidoreductase [Ancylobacter lacus]